MLISEHWVACTSVVLSLLISMGWDLCRGPDDALVLRVGDGYAKPATEAVRISHK
jgi:hypothetical protein